MSYTPRDQIRIIFNTGKTNELHKKSLLSQLGPGLIYAGAAVGVSHLVQSTKAGGMFGFDLIIAIVIIHLVKYPFFEFGP